ncbi:MAG TPA: hypothetical protein VK947_09890 [Planococcus sp. (in: firmicutes)]|nr:hypothetical protein [Planococcus sp. (in: firmicutes)]
MRRNICLAFLTISLLLGACTAEPANSEEATFERVSYEDASIIQHLTIDSVMADGIYYGVIPESVFSLTSGFPIERDDLKPGDLVFISPASQFSPSGSNHNAKSITVLDDDKSRKISRAITHLMDHQEVGEIISPEIKSVNHQLVTVQFKECDTGQLYESIINVNTFSFHIQPIGRIK